MDITWFFQAALDFFTPSPFWYWVFLGFVTTCFCVLVSWFFPPLRSVAGAVVLAIIAGLSGYRRAEYDVDRKQKAKEPTQPKQGSDGWHW